jgi:hypothetical protein
VKLALLLVLSTWFFTTAAAGQEPIAPYSAQRIAERVQTLADGTRITQTPQKVKEYRDSAGRTRTEQLSASDTEAERVTSINITDPVAGFRYVLDPEARTAHEVSLPKREAKATAPVAPKQGEQPLVWRDSLGTETVDGLLIRGTRTTTIYPAEFFGNDRPVTVIRESWISPELATVVMTKVSDPRTGESTSRLMNISPSEPDSSLFQVPAGYEIIDGGPAPMTVTRRP